MTNKKFTIEDYDAAMERVRQRHREPVGFVDRLKGAAIRRRLPRLPRIK